MTKRTSSEKLPEPRHPFARWCAAAAVSLWAMGAQIFPDPWNKLGAILSPGVGYIFGQVLDSIIHRVSAVSSKRKQQQDLKDNRKKIDDLYKERQDAVGYGASPEVIKSIDSLIVVFQKYRIDMIAQSARPEGKGSKS